MSAAELRLKILSRRASHSVDYPTGRRQIDAILEQHGTSWKALQDKSFTDEVALKKMWDLIEPIR